MPSISSTIPRRFGDGKDVIPMHPCVWCGQPTMVRAATPFRPDLGAVPLMLTCGGEIIVAYGDYMAGRALSLDWQNRIAHLATLARLEAGS